MSLRVLTQLLARLPFHPFLNTFALMTAKRDLFMFSTLHSNAAYLRGQG